MINYMKALSRFVSLVIHYLPFIARIEAKVTTGRCTYNIMYIYVTELLSSLSFFIPWQQYIT